MGASPRCCTAAPLVRHSAAKKHRLRHCSMELEGISITPPLLESNHIGHDAQRRQRAFRKCTQAAALRRRSQPGAAVSSSSISSARPHRKRSLCFCAATQSNCASGRHRSSTQSPCNNLLDDHRAGSRHPVRACRWRSGAMQHGVCSLSLHTHLIHLRAGVGHNGNQAASARNSAR